MNSFLSPRGKFSGLLKKESKSLKKFRGSQSSEDFDIVQSEEDSQSQRAHSLFDHFRHPTSPQKKESITDIDLCEYKFSEFIAIQECRENLMSYMMILRNEEQVFFLKEVEEFKLLHDLRERNETGIKIVNKYIKKSSDYELNLGNEGREELISTVELITNEDSILPPNLFDRIYNSILVDIRTDIFPRYCLSQQFKDLLEKLDPKLISTFENIHIVEYKI
eukprot:gene4563-7947_t